MKEGWSYKKLGEVCDFEGGSQPPKSEWINHPQDGYVRMLQIRDFTRSRNAEIEYVKISKKIRLCKADDILIGRYGASVGKILTGLAGAYNVAIIKSIPNEELISKAFIKRYLGFSKDDICDTPIPVPPLSEQRSIVSRLDTAFSHIDALKANAEKQLNEARKLFQAELTECMKPKEGWEEKTLKEVGITQTGTTPPKSDTSNYGEYISFIRPAELNFDGMGGINYESEIKLSEKGVERSRLIKANSILMCCIGSVGKMGFSTKEVTCNQQINTITPKSNYSPKFVYYAMLDKKFLDDIIKEAKSAQATLPIISKGKWERHKIHVPYLVEQHAIVSHLDSLSSNIRKLEELQQKTLTECDALKQAMLREVFE